MTEFQKGQQVAEAKANYPELTGLPDEVILELVAQNFKCCVSGESVLQERQNYWVVKYREELAPKMGIQYSCLLPHYWDPQHEEDLEIFKKLTAS